MELTGERRIRAGQARVWEALNDPAVLARAIPGCEALAEAGEHAFEAKVRARIGPLNALFEGRVELTDIRAPESYVLRGSGKGGPAGFASGEAKVVLRAGEPGVTLLSYAVAAKVGGKLAQIGQRLIDGTARKLADEFFEAFAAIVETLETGPAEPAAAPAPPAPAPEAERALRRAALSWMIGLGLALAAFALIVLLHEG